jgi:fumarate reductase subunit D
MKKKFYKYLCSSIVVGVGFLPILAIAAATNPITQGYTFDPTGVEGTFEFIKTTVAGIIFILGILMILYAAFLYMTSAGDDSRIEKAKKTFIYGIVGIIIALLAYGIWTTVVSFLTAS